MTKKQTIDLPDEPGIWISRHCDEMLPVHVCLDSDGQLVARFPFYEVRVSQLDKGQWQGPIKWNDEVNP